MDGWNADLFVLMSLRNHKIYQRYGITTYIYQILGFRRELVLLIRAQMDRSLLKRIDITRGY